jgi:hypothetical protein
MKRTSILTAAVLVIATAAASCGDQPTAPTTDASRVTAPADASGGMAPGLSGKKDKDRAALLTNVPITGALSDGGTFVGTFTAKRLSYDEATKTLSMTGVLTGTATTAAGVVSTVTQEFTTPITLSRSSSASAIHTASAMLSCSVLFLDLGPLHLDLLGLVVDLNEVVLAVNAVTGASALLGNLLCAILGLLDIPGAIAGLLQLIDSINAILAGLTTPAAAATGAALAAPMPFMAHQLMRSA